MTQQIKLTKGMFAIVDDDDFPELSKYKWYAKKGTNTYYAMHSRPLPQRMIAPKEIRMHRLILNAPESHEVDHINGNGLDNRRSNLRLATHAQNLTNQELSIRNTSGFRGVDWDKNIRNGKRESQSMA